MTETILDPSPLPATADDDPGPQPAPIVVSVPELLAAKVGTVHDLSVQPLDDETYAWSGVGDGGRPLSGTLRCGFEVGGDAASFVIRSTVVHDGDGA